MSRDDEELYSDEHEVTCSWCGHTFEVEDVGDLSSGDDLWCGHCDGIIEVTAVDYSVTITTRKRDRWADFCEAWGRIARHYALDVERNKL